MNAVVESTEVKMDLDRDGKNYGCIKLRLCVDRTYSEVIVPIVVFRRGAGKSVLLTSSIHGDEYEGPIALTKLINELDCSSMTGRLIVVPYVNLPALIAGQRHSPIDGLDLNRSFPGTPTGSVTPVLAHILAGAVVPYADLVIDLHTGGTGTTWIPCAMMHYISDSALFAESLATVRAMHVPAGVVIDEGDKEGMFDTYVENKGKMFISCEFGGGCLSRENLAVAECGIRNALIHFDVITGNIDVPEWRGERVSRMLQVPNLDWTVSATTSGLFEPLVDPGDDVKRGTAIGRVYSIYEPQTEPEVIIAPRDGVLFMRRASGRIDCGQRAAMVAECLKGEL